MNPNAEAFYAEVLREFSAMGVPYLLAGTYAVSAYTGVIRPTKDLDVFCKGGDFPRVLDHFQKMGYAISVEDERWLGKVHKGDMFFDVIFASSNGTMPVGDAWFADAREIELFDVPVRIIGPTELIWSKAFIQLRHRYDGADVVHVMLKQSEQIDWKRLLDYMELHWEVLLVALLNFRFIYPSERHLIPRWVMDELLERLNAQLQMPSAGKRVCRGRIFSPRDYQIDVGEWGFSEAVGNLEENYATAR